jgi:hypothetical protein
VSQHASRAPDRVRERVARYDWRELAGRLANDGYARLPGLLSAHECRDLLALYGDEDRFRARVSLERYRFGAGEYKYFAYPLPPLVARLRAALYPRLAVIANAWLAALGNAERYPRALRRFLAHCHERGQERPTPLMLRYGAGGFNCLHQDLYGDVWFPFQATCMLSRPESDFSGGEFLLLEQRPRMQAQAEAIALRAGEGIVFPTRERPVEGTRGYYRSQIRHGVSRVRSGERTTLGIIFHDAA